MHLHIHLVLLGHIAPALVLGTAMDRPGKEIMVAGFEDLDGPGVIAGTRVHGRRMNRTANAIEKGRCVAPSGAGSHHAITGDRLPEYLVSGLFGGRSPHLEAARAARPAIGVRDGH